MNGDGDRAAVAAVLEGMCVKGGQLCVDAPHSSTRHYGDSAARMRVWRGIIDELTSEAVPREGRAAIVTAGPPGAGKSTALEKSFSTGELAGWRRLDADVVKEHLIRLALLDGIYDHLLAIMLPDHRSLMPMELAGLVHRESVDLMVQLRRVCMERGENVILEGTLSYPGMIGVHLGEIASRGYDELDVLVVDVDRQVAIEQALRRWWSGRNDSSSALGGRFVPQSSIDNCYDAGRSVCRQNAQELVHRARLLAGLNVRMLDPADAAAPLRVIAENDG